LSRYSLGISRVGDITSSTPLLGQQGRFYVALLFFAALRKDSIYDGVHIMAVGRKEVVPGILAAAGL